MSNLIQELMDIKAININTQNFFTWASGLKSPIYIDNRLIISHPILRTKIANELSGLIKKEYFDKHIPIDAFFGTATAGIPHAVLTSHLLNMPCGYVRSGKKDHGKGNQIEGHYAPGQRVLVVEDLISTGGSVLKVIDALEEAGLIVVGVVAIFSYNLQIAKDNFARKQIPYQTLLTFDDLISNSHVNQMADKDVLLSFQQSL